MKPKVLLGCPTHRCKKYALEEYVRGVRAIRDFSKDHFAAQLMQVDNTPDGGAHKRWMASRYPDIEFLHVDVRTSPKDKERIHKRIVASCNLMRERLIQQPDISWFLSVEADVIPPPEALLSLTSHGSEAVQGYFYNQDFSEESFKKSPFWLMGISLIKADIVRKIPFRYDPNLLPCFPDGFFGHDMHAHGIAYSFCGAVRCKHVNEGGYGRGWHQA